MSPQAGVDVFGTREEKQIGVQCKQKDGLLRSKLTVTELDKEVDEAKSFRPALSTFIVATTGPRDGRVQEHARLLSEVHKSNGLFSVEVWSWKDIWHELYQREELLNRVGPIYWRHSHRLARGRVSTKSRFVISALLLAILAAVVLHLVKSRRDEIGPSVSTTTPAASNLAALPLIRIETLDGLPEGMTHVCRSSRFKLR
jgi:hypothetical protein